MIQQFGLSIRAACQALSLSHSVYSYQPDTTRDDPVIAALQNAVERYPRYGFKKLFLILRRQGHAWNHKRIYRVYCLLKLNLRRKGKQRLPNRHPQPLCVAAIMNQTWSMDFMHDALSCGRKFRTFNVVDDFNREALALERGYPQMLRMDNGPEFISLALANGQKLRKLNSNLSSLGHQRKMLTLNDLTGLIELKYWIFIYSKV